MSDLPSEYDYEYRWQLRAGTPKHNYIIRTEHGAIHFHVSDLSRLVSDARERYSAGLERHYRAAPSHMRGRAPSHSPCCILSAPCWHDGTSLYAQESLLPLWLHDHSPEAVFGWLVVEARRFDADCTEEVSDE